MTGGRVGVIPVGMMKARQILKETFGIDQYRPHQQEAVEAVLAGRDVLLTMPTGGGKSLVYQLPAVVLEGLTLVVSPLISLMKDQVDALERKGVAATYVNSSLSAAEREKRLEAAVGGKLDLLFVTPERFRSPVFEAVIPKLNVTRLAVDEAHCISQWGHDFRPDYSRLAEYRQRLGNPPTLALTATATPPVAADIVKHLSLRDPVIVRAGLERANLFLASQQVYDQQQKVDRIEEILKQVFGAGIIYGSVIRDLTALHEELRRRGWQTLFYHGELSQSERRAMQEQFMASEDQIILATNAFGMGIDKADIRFVIHTQVPRTFEAWMQEIGRAGRDGKPAWCELLYLEEDLAVQHQFIEWANPSLDYFVGVYRTLERWGSRIVSKDIDDLRSELLYKNKADHRVNISLKWLEVLGLTEGSFEQHNLRIAASLDVDALPQSVGCEDKRRADLEGLLGVVRFASGSEVCRRQSIAVHFELEPLSDSCGACDVCMDAVAELEKQFTPRQTKPTPLRTAKFERGDWVRVDGRHIGQIVKVRGQGDRIKLIVESATDLRKREVDPRRQRVRKMENQSG